MSNVEHLSTVISLSEDEVKLAIEQYTKTKYNRMLTFCSPQNTLVRFKMSAYGEVNRVEGAEVTISSGDPWDVHITKAE